MAKRTYTPMVESSEIEGSKPAAIPDSHSFLHNELAPLQDATLARVSSVVKPATPSHIQQLQVIYDELKASSSGEHVDSLLKRKLQAIFHAIGVFSGK